MLSHPGLRRQAYRAAPNLWQQPSRGLAAPASGSFQYATAEVNGVKTASRDIPGPVSSLSLVSQAGTRFQPLPGLAEGLERYAFKSTERRSTLRIQRESELLGSSLQASRSRESVVIGAKFLRDDLPYFVELLAEVASMTKYQTHVFHEEVYPLMEMALKKHLGNPVQLATNSAHGLAFHRGLGDPLQMSTSMPMKKYLDADSIAEYAQSAYTKSSFALVANGVSQEELSKWVGEFFNDIKASPSTPLQTVQTKYFGGEERHAHASGNALVMAFPGSSSPTGAFFKPEVSVLAALLGGQSSIKWSPGFSLLSRSTQAAPNMFIDSNSLIYSDAGLLTVTMSGSASDISMTAPKVVETLKSVAENITEEDFRKAKALAKFKELEFGEETQAGMELTGRGLLQSGKPYQIDEVAKAVDGVTMAKVKQIAKEAVQHKASVSAVGDLHILPFAEELGLKV